MLLESADLRTIGDVDRGAFDEVPNEILAAVMSVLRRALPGSCGSVAMQPTAPNDLSYDRQRTNRKRAAVLAQLGRHEFHPSTLASITARPIVYWWSEAFLKSYAAAAKLDVLGGNSDPVDFMLATVSP